MAYVMRSRQVHQQEVRVFLQKQLSIDSETFSLPEGSGRETYVVGANGCNYFVKVGAPVERYIVMAKLGLTPPVLAHGQLETGDSVIVQPFVPGRKPSQRDYWEQLENVAQVVDRMHHGEPVRDILPPSSSDSHRDAALKALRELHETWEQYRDRVRDAATFVDRSLAWLAKQIDSFSTQGLVASHNDICDANWLFADDGNIYLIDFDSLALDDPALDLGALLWWYYPPELRRRFLEIAGYRQDDELAVRMRVRMSMHCLHIALPRPGTFDVFSPDHFRDRMEDFGASLEGKENPKGYTRW